MSRHPEAPGVVDNEQVRAAALDEFGANTGASSCGDDRLAAVQCVVQSSQDLCSRVRVADARELIGDS